MMPLWLQYLFLFGFPTFWAITLIVWFIDHAFLTPKESKVLKKAKRKKKPIVPVAFDNGQIEFKVAKEIGDEGYVKTEDNWIGFLPRPVSSNPDTEADAINPYISRVFILKDAKIPFLCGYAGKAVLTNPQALAMLEYAQEQEQKVRLPFGKKDFKVDIFWPVNFRAIKNAFAKSWNQAQVRASEVKSELTGMLKGKKYFGMEGWKPLIAGVSIILALGIILVLVLVLAPRVL